LAIPPVRTCGKVSVTLDPKLEGLLPKATPLVQPTFVSEFGLTDESIVPEPSFQPATTAVIPASGIHFRAVAPRTGIRKMDSRSGNDGCLRAPLCGFSFGQQPLELGNGQP
jgi:hypothetical protein